eukprot:c1221_g1_i1.p1 GENE.c1221_g1_i1~~c1221_g1_i1.p1  ORF type:complete len:374 (+),score=82.67 c1221_g1_i1:163-1122(+)
MRDRDSGMSAGYGFVDFANHQAALQAIQSMNQYSLYGREIKVNWAHHSSQKEEGVTLFVGDLANEIDDTSLFKAFSVVGVVSDARVMWDPVTKKSRGYGFVTFRTREEAEKAMKEMNGQMLGTRGIRVNWAVKTPSSARTAIGDSSRGDERSSRTVYVGNLSPDITDHQLQLQFHDFGMIEEIRCNAEKGYGFITFGSPSDASRAIEMMNGRVLGSRQIKVAWGREKEKSQQPSQYGLPGSFQLPIAPPMPTQSHFLPPSPSFSSPSLQFYPHQQSVLTNYNIMYPMPFSRQVPHVFPHIYSPPSASLDGTGFPHPNFQ